MAITFYMNAGIGTYSTKLELRPLTKATDLPLMPELSGNRSCAKWHPSSQLLFSFSM